MTSRIRAEWHRTRIRYNVWRMSFPLHVRRRTRRLMTGVLAVVLLATNLTFIAFLDFDKAEAGTATFTSVPNSPDQTRWPEQTGCTATTHYDCVDENTNPGTTSPNDATDYINTGTGGSTGETADFNMTTQAFDSNEATQVVVSVRAMTQTLANTADTLTVNLVINGSTVAGTTFTPTNGSWSTDATSTFTGTWTQANIDDMRVQVVRNRQGSGGNPSTHDDDIRVSTVWATVTYTTTAEIEQSSYRWFNNQDSTGYDSFVTTQGGSANDVGYAVKATSDGGYIVAGTTLSYTAGSDDIMVTKYDIAGGEEWTKTIGGASQELGNSVIEMSDGGFVITGFTESYGAGLQDVIAVKLSATGVEEWTKTLGGAGGEISNGVSATSDGGFIVAGYSATYGTGANDAFISKFNSTGNEQWTTTIEGASGTNTIPRKAIELSDGSMVVVGYTNAYGAGDYDIFLSKLNPTNGVEIWTKTMGGTGIDYGHNVIESSDGSLMVTGRTTSYSAGDNDLYLAKFDFAGEEIWTKTIGGAGFEVGLSLVETDAGDFVVAGYGASYSASEDMLLVKFNSSGVEQWTTTVGGSGVDWGWSMDKLAAGGFIVVGKSASYGAGGDDFLISRFTDSGTIANCTTICTSQTVTEVDRSTSSAEQNITSISQTLTEGNETVTEVDRSPQLLVTCGSVDLYYGYVVGGTGTDIGRSIAVDGSGNYVVAGQTASYGSGGTDVMLVKYNAAGEEQWSVTWGGGVNTEIAYGVVVDGNGDYVISGHTLSFTTPASVFIAKFNSSGVEQWSKTWGGASGDFSNGLIVDASNNYYVYGEAQSLGGGDEILLMKFDVNGVEQWTKTMGTSAQDLARGGAIDASGNIYLTGQTASSGAGGLDAFVSKFDSTGVEQWSVTWGGAGNDYGYDIDLDSAGNIGITGFTASYGTANNAFIAVFNSSGTEQWSAHVGGSSGEYGNAIIADADDNWVMVGEVESFGAGGDDAYISKYTTSGSHLYTHTYGGTGGDLVRDIQQDANGFYVLPGEFDTFGSGLDDISLLKISPDGDRCSSICQVQASSVSTAITITQGTWTITESADQAIAETDRTPTLSTVTGSTTEEAVFELLEVPSADVGTALNSVAQNTATTATTEGTPFRLRANLHVTTDGVEVGDLEFKLQYAEKVGTCDTSFVGEVFADVTTTSEIAYYVANDIPDGVGLTANANDPTHSTDSVLVQEYVSYTTFGIKRSIAMGEDGLWDFALVDNGADANTAYCFRIVTSAGTQLTTYTVVPEITIADADFEMAGYRWFEDEVGAGNTTFAQALGGTGTELGRAIVQNTDGSFVTAGYSSSTGVAGATDAMLTKWDAYGEEVWTKVLGGAGTEQVIGLAKTTDGGYVAGGYTTSYGTGGDLMLMKFDENGNEVWTKTAGGADLEFIRDLEATSDGGFVGAGYTTTVGVTAGSADMMVVKFTSAGEISWTTVIGRAGADYGERIIETAGGDFIITGNTQSTADMTAGSADLWLVKLNSSGVEQWTKTLGGTGFDVGQDVIEDSAGNFIVVGNADSYASLGAENTITKFNSSGVEQWTKYWGGSGTDRAQAVVEVSDGYVVTGYGNTAGGGNQDLVLTKFTTSGQIVWARTVGGATDDWGLDLIETLDGGVAALGYATSYGAGVDDLFWAKFNSDGNINDCTDCRAYYVAEATATVTEIDRTATTTNAADPSWTMADQTSNTTFADFTSTLANDMACGEGITFMKSISASPTEFHDGIQAADGGYVAVGRMSGVGAGSLDGAVAKYNTLGEVEWFRLAGGTGSDAFYSVIQTADGGYLAAGYTASYGAGGSQDGYLVKYDSSGTIEWSRAAGGTGTEYFQSVIQTYDGGYLAVGQDDSYGGSVNAYLVKYNSSGTIEWSRTQGADLTTFSETFYDVVQTSDGGYVAAGVISSTLSADSELGYLVKFNSSGDEEWKQRFGNDSTTFYGLAGASDGGFAAFGESFASGPPYAILVKTDSSGLVGSCGVYCSAAPLGSSTSVSSTANSPSSTANSPSSTANSPSSTETVLALTSSVLAAVTNWLADGVLAKVGTPLASLNTATTLTRADTPLRLRALIHTTTKTPFAGSKYFKLQYSVKSGTCDTSFTGESYSDVTKLSTFRSYNSRSLINGSSLATSANDPTNGVNEIVYQNYNGAGFFTPSTAMTRGASSLWDLGVTPYEAPDNSYCLRIVKGDGSLLDTTSYVAEVTVPIPSVQQMRHGQSFSSTNPGVKQGFYW